MRVVESEVQIEVEMGKAEEPADATESACAEDSEVERCLGCAVVMSAVGALRVKVVKLQEENRRLRKVLERSAEGCDKEERVSALVDEVMPTAEGMSFKPVVENAKAMAAAEEARAKAAVRKAKERPAAEKPMVNSWAEVAKMSRPVMPTAAAASQLTDSRKILLRNGFMSASQQSPTPVYFGGVHRGTVGKSKRCILEGGALPKWAMLEVSFIGTSTVLVMCQEPLVLRLLATTKRVGFRHIEKFDVMTSPLRAGDRNAAKNMCVRCWTKSLEAACGIGLKWAYEGLLAKTGGAEERKTSVEVVGGSGRYYDGEPCCVSTSTCFFVGCSD